MTERKAKTERPVHVTLSFRDEKNPDAKPSISDAQTRLLLSGIEAGEWREELAQGCDLAGCGLKVDGLKRLVLDLASITLSCRYSCEWFYSRGGGWEHVCYADCQGGGLHMEATL